MLNKYDVLERLTVVGGYMGHIIVWLGMAAGCILLWYFIFAFVFNS